MEDLRGKWTRYIEPGETAFIGRNVSLHVVMKNLGPGMVAIPIGHRGDLEKLIAGTLLVYHHSEHGRQTGARCNGVLSVV